jgi:hypothetical protein
MSKNAILAVIALALVAIAGAYVYETTKKSPGEEIADSIGEAAEEVGDAAKDAAN